MAGPASLPLRIRPTDDDRFAHRFEGIVAASAFSVLAWAALGSGALAIYRVVATG